MQSSANVMAPHDIHVLFWCGVLLTGMQRKNSLRLGILMNDPVDAYCVFEGGGARGVAHVGALKNIEEFEKARQIKVKGYAGTSAGALIATLAACEFTADEILAPDDSTGSSIFGEISDPKISSSPHLFRRSHWIYFWLYRWSMNHPSFAASLAIVPTIILLFLAVRSIHVASLGISIFAFLTLLVYIFVCWLLIRSIPSAIALRKLAFELDQLLRNKLGVRKQNPAQVEAARKRWNGWFKLNKNRYQLDDPITFGDLAKRGINLSVVASNITKRKVSLFSTKHNHTHGTSVSLAVASSIAIPFVFRNIYIGHPHNSEYQDGGMVSNLPGWIFDSELLRNPEGWLISCEIDDSWSDLVNRGGALPLKMPEGENQEMAMRRSNWGRRRNRARGGALIKSIGLTALFGARSLEYRGFSNVVRQSLVAEDVGMLDLDLGPQKARDVANRGRNRGYYDLVRHANERRYLRLLAESAQKQCNELGVENDGIVAALFRPAFGYGTTSEALTMWASVGFRPNQKFPRTLFRSSWLEHISAKGGLIIDPGNHVDVGESGWRLSDFNWIFTAEVDFTEANLSALEGLKDEFDERKVNKEGFSRSSHLIVAGLGNNHAAENANLTLIDLEKYLEVRIRDVKIKNG